MNGLTRWLLGFFAAAASLMVGWAGSELWSQSEEGKAARAKYIPFVEENRARVVVLEAGRAIQNERLAKLEGQFEYIKVPLEDIQRRVK